MNEYPERLYTEQERSAMRAYLQRCEVRISTQHRIAIAFISGAGLMLLIPVFFKDVIDSIIEIWLKEHTNQFTQLGSVGGTVLTLILYLLLAYPLLLSLSVPLYGVLLLLKDIVHFYFTIYMPGFAPTLLNPTLALSGIAFSTDEVPGAKEAIMRFQYRKNHIDFMIPFSEERRTEYFDTILETTHGEITPPYRQFNKLETQEVIPEQIERHTDIRHFNAALGIARSLDRTLIEEVAITEMMLVRNSLYLRRLMLRYVKTLIMFIWTTLVSFIMLPFLKDERFPTFIVFGIGYVIWSLAVMRLLIMPISWIYRHRYEGLSDDHIDTQLSQLESQVYPFARVSIVTSILGLILATITQL